MKTLHHFRPGHEPYFHAHPMHVMFSLITSILLAGIVVLILVDAAK
jgi:hypothetical protein